MLGVEKEKKRARTMGKVIQANGKFTKKKIVLIVPNCW